MNIIFKTYLLLVFFAAGFVACSKDSVDVSDDGNKNNAQTQFFAFDVGKVQLSSRKTENPYNLSDYFLPSGECIGISLEDAPPVSGVYGSTSTYANVKYEASGTGTSQTWQNLSGIPIVLNKDSAHVSAYRPYNVATNPLAIPINCLSVIDYLYAPYKAWTNSGYLYCADSYAHIKLSHAQAIIIFSYENDGYVGAGQLTKSEVGGGAIGMQGILNSTTGAMSSISGSYLRNYTTPKSLPTTSGTTEYLDSIYVIPTEDPAGIVSFKLTIDGIDFKVDSPVKELKRGYIYYFPLRNKGDKKELELGNVEIWPWNTYALPQLNLIDELVLMNAGLLPIPGT